MSKPGTWQKGQSGNPEGRPKAYKTVVDLARKRTVRAIKTLTEIMENPGCDDSARVKAAATLLERGWGKPAQPVEIKHVRSPREMSLEDIQARLADLRAAEAEH